MDLNLSEWETQLRGLLAELRAQRGEIIAGAITFTESTCLFVEGERLTIDWIIYEIDWVAGKINVRYADGFTPLYRCPATEYSPNQIDELVSASLTRLESMKKYRQLTRSTHALTITWRDYGQSQPGKPDLAPL